VRVLAQAQETAQMQFCYQFNASLTLVQLPALAYKS
jgi:hypothetical protein